MNQAVAIYVIGQLIPALFYVITFVLHFYYSRLPVPLQQTVREIAQEIVPALEQSAPLLNGAAKKQEATRLINSILPKNLQAPPELIDACIESAVYSLNQLVPTQKTTKIPTLPK